MELRLQFGNERTGADNGNRTGEAPGEEVVEQAAPQDEQDEGEYSHQQQIGFWCNAVGGGKNIKIHYPEHDVHCRAGEQEADVARVRVDPAQVVQIKNKKDDQPQGEQPDKERGLLH